MERSERPYSPKAFCLSGAHTVRSGPAYERQCVRRGWPTKSDAPSVVEGGMKESGKAPSASPILVSSAPLTDQGLSMKNYELKDVVPTALGRGLYVIFLQRCRRSAARTGLPRLRLTRLRLVRPLGCAHFGELTASRATLRSPHRSEQCPRWKNRVFFF